MRFLFSTGSLYTYSITRCFGFAASAGFDGMELMVDERWDTRQLGYIQSLVSQYKLPVVAVHAPLRLIPGWEMGVPAHIKSTVKMAEHLDADLVVHHLPMRFGFGMLRIQSRQYLVPFPWWSMHKDYILWLKREYSQFQTTTNVQLCIENMPATHLFGQQWNPSPWNTIETIQRFTSLTMDTTHLGTWNLEPVEVYSRWAGRVKHIHLSNYNGRQHRRPEDGDLRLDHLVAHLAETGYNGTISIETSPDALDAGCDDEHMVKLLTNSLQYCRSWAVSGAHVI
ncbi:MAG: sugar phosphate isomerase/epimerase [Anaerolineae bacterium]|nr:sugar phosphate isomerase/epimerase [Anaerolineae bacterium]